ncbi:MAG: hypothetical protein H7124_12090 [Phycisphaerales bacterium]|nr:hypothetical protein [Hyphomonadaceae bacterium]
MRARSLGAALAAAALLAACDPAPMESPAETQAASFEDGGCIAILLLQRNAIALGGAQGDEAPLTVAIAAWRAAAENSLSTAELAQYEASSLAVENDTGPADLQARAATCVQTTPQA